MASHLCGFGHVVGGCHLLRGLEPSGATSKALRVASDSYSGNRFANIGSSALRWAAGCRLIGIIMEGVREAVPLQSLDFNLEGLEEEKANEGLHVVPTWPQELGSWLASLADSLSVQSISTVATGAWKTVMSCLLRSTVASKDLLPAPVKCHQTSCAKRWRLRAPLAGLILCSFLRCCREICPRETLQALELTAGRFTSAFSSLYRLTI